MFNNETVNRAIQYTESVRSNQLAVFPADVELGKVVESYIFPLMNAKGLNLAGGDLDTITKFLTGNGDDETGDALDIEANKIAQVVQNNINLARNVAVPMIRRAVEIIDAQIEGLNEEIRNVLSVNIAPNPIYEIIAHDATIGEIIKSASKSTYTEYGHGLKLLPRADYQTIVEMCHTGSAPFDDVVGKVFSHVGESEVVRLYNTYLAAGQAQHKPMGDRLHSMLVVYLMGYAITSNLKGDNIPEGVEVPLEELSRKSLEFRAVCRHRLATFVNDYHFKASTGSVVYDQYYDDNSQRHLNVIASVYEKAVEQGITTDVIIGSTLAEVGTWHLSSLIRDKDTYQKAFAKHNEKFVSETEARRGEIVTNALRTAVQQIANDESYGVKLKDINWDEFKTRLRGQLQLQSGADSTQVMVKFLLNYLFEGTLVPRIVRTMDDLASEMPDARPEVVAARVALMITIEHMLSRVKLVNVG